MIAKLTATTAASFPRLSRVRIRSRAMASIATLRRLQATALSQMILAEDCPVDDDRSFAIIDVRDDDYIGGHIRGSINCPSNVIPSMIPGLVRRLRNKKVVVFHCALSQQRGPGAALRYAREREEIVRGEREKRLREKRTREKEEKEENGEGEAGEQKERAEKQEETEQVAETAAGEIGEQKKEEREAEDAEEQDQVVYVLDRGFVGWQEKYGDDVRLTEGYRKELWKNGYWQ